MSRKKKSNTYTHFGFEIMSWSLGIMVLLVLFWNVCFKIGDSSLGVRAWGFGLCALTLAFINWSLKIWKWARISHSYLRLFIFGLGFWLFGMGIASLGFGCRNLGLEFFGICFLTGALLFGVLAIICWSLWFYIVVWGLMRK
jgi:hypothetical protein